MDAAQGLGRRWAAYRPTKGLLFWAVAAGAIATIVVGFAWGGWVTGGTAKRMAEAAAVGSRDALVAAVCVDRFQAAGDAQAQLAMNRQLAALRRQQRRAYEVQMADTRGASAAVLRDMQLGAERIAGEFRKLYLQAASRFAS